MAIKNIPVNTTLPADKLVGLIKRVDTLEKCKVAEKWIVKNTVISKEQKYSMLSTLYFKKSVILNHMVNNIPAQRRNAQRVEGRRA